LLLQIISVEVQDQRGCGCDNQ